MEDDFTTWVLPEDGPLMSRNASGGKIIVYASWKILWNSYYKFVYILFFKYTFTREIGIYK